MDTPTDNGSDFDAANTEITDEAFGSPLIAPVKTSKSKPRAVKPGFWSGLAKGQLNIKRDNLLTWWPGVAAFLWFASLVLFGGMSLFIYILQGAPEKGLQVFGLISALHLGALVVLFLATVVENPDPVEKQQGPFALSLQASFVEALSVAGLLVYIISEEKIEKTTLPIFDNYLNITLPQMATKDGSYLYVYAGLLIVILILSFFGFSLLKRRDRLTSPILRGEFQNEGPPPIESDNPRQRIAYLTRLKAELLQMAHRAGVAVERDDTKLKVIAANRLETEAELKAVQDEILALCYDQEAFCATQACLKTQIESLSAKVGDPARTRSRKWLEKIKRLLISGLGVVDSGDGLFLDALERLRLTEAALADALTQRANEQKILESELAEHRAEARKLAQEAARLEGELTELNRFAEHIDSTNEAWRQSYEWTALIGKDELTLSHVIPANTYNTSKLNAKGGDTIDKIRTGILWLFGFSALLAVIGDFLLEMPGNAVSGANSVLTPMGVTVLGLLVIIYWIFKLVYSLGLMGSWRSITASFRDERDEDSAPEWSGTLKIMASNGLGILAFAALFVPFVQWINLLAEDEATRLITPTWFGDHLPPIDLSRMTGLLKTDYQVILPILIVAALLIFIAPLFIHIWEAQFRRTKDHTSALAIFKAIVMGIIGLGVLAVISVAADRLSSHFRHGLTDAVVPPPPPPQTRLQCPLDQLTSNEGVRINAWRLGQANEVVLTPTPSLMSAPSSCQIDINPLGNTNFIVLIGAASEQGGFDTERERAAERIDNAARFLSPALREAIGNGTISIYSVNLGKYCALPDRRRISEKACLRARQTAGAADPTEQQRPLVIVSGFIAPNEDVEPELSVEKKVYEALERLGVHLDDYPDPKLDKKPVKRGLVCPKDKPCILTTAPKPAPIAKVTLSPERDAALSLTPPALPPPDSALPESEGISPSETAVATSSASGN